MVGGDRLHRPLDRLQELDRARLERVRSSIDELGDPPAGRGAVEGALLVCGRRGLDVRGELGEVVDRLAKTLVRFENVVFEKN